MPVIVSDEILAAARLTPAEALKELALALFKQERLTLAQAARLAGVGRLKFQEWMAERKIPIHYDVAEFEKDVATLRKLGRI
jgi:predicted HTH domain antitoxin